MSALSPALGSSEREDWETPQPLFDLLDAEFGFTLDSAANAANAKCGSFWSVEDDGLSQPWEGVVWCNPPYGRGISAWLRKGYESAQCGSTVVMLIPARCDTAWWHEYVMRAAEVRLMRGRPVFNLPGGATASNAPFPVAIVVFRPGEHRPAFTSTGRGDLLPRSRSGASTDTEQTNG